MKERSRVLGALAIRPGSIVLTDLRLTVRNLMQREVKTSLSAILAMVMLTFLLFVAGLIRATTSGTSYTVSGADVVTTFAGLSVIVALLLGVLCGAEEEENQTSDFVLRLPAHRQRILLEKIAGSALAFALWLTLEAIACSFILILFGRSGPGELLVVLDFFRGMDVLGSGEQFLWCLRWSSIMYCFGLVAGAWTRRVLLAAVLGGGSAMIYTIVTMAFLGGGAAFNQGPQNWAPKIVWFGCAAAIAAAAYRYHTREGT